MGTKIYEKINTVFNPDFFSKKLFDELTNIYLISYAQFEEDIILYRMLSSVKNGNYVDVGCSDPHNLSVTKLFYEHGWSGINIDSRQIEIDKYTAVRQRDINICMAISDKIEVKKFFISGDISTFDEETANRIGIERFKQTNLDMIPLTLLLDIYNKNRVIHFLKIDVEKYEKYVLKGLDFNKYRPWVICIESMLPCTGIPSYNDWEPILLAANYECLLNYKINRFYVAKEKKEEIMNNFNSCMPAFIYAKHMNGLRKIYNTLAEFNQSI